MKKSLTILLSLMLFIAACTPALAAAGIERISEDGLTFTIFKPSHTVFGTQIDDWNETLVFQEMEKRTGVHLDFITPVLGQEVTQLQLLVSSGSYPDFICGTNNYTGGGEALLNDGVVVDLSEYLTKLPNFSAELNQTELRRKEVFTDSGRIAGFPSFYQNDEESEIFVGLLLRKDLLDEVGMDIPVTYDDWYNVLTAFKEQCGITKGFVPGPEMFSQNNMWTIGYGFGYVDYFGSNVPFYQIDGKVRYAPIDDAEAFKAYLEMMAKWYKEGLIDPDFQTVTDVNAQIATYSSPDCGACVTAYSLAPLLASIGGQFKEGFEYVCVPIPVLEEGQTPHMYAETTHMDLNQILITTQCRELDLALKYWDQYYTEEGSLISCWGVEGETFEFDAEGNPQWTDYIVNNPDYNYVSMRHATLASMLPSVYERRAHLVEEQSIANDRMYRQKGDNLYRISGNVTLTEDENDIYNSYYKNNILTYVQEKCIRYITGAESFDSYDQLADEIRAMGIDQVLAVYQGALDRYNAR